MNKTTERTATVWPTLTYRDARAAIRFLVDAFGFEEIVSYPGADESTVSHAELRWPAGGGVMLGTARADSVIADLPPGTGSIYVVTEDPDGLFERARAAGARVVEASAAPPAPPFSAFVGLRPVRPRDSTTPAAFPRCLV